MLRRSIAHTAHERRQEARYPLPNVMQSYDELMRALHRDLPDMETARLVRERYRVNDRLMHEDGPAPWLEERLLAIEDELAARRHRPPIHGAAVRPHPQAGSRREVRHA